MCVEKVGGALKPGVGSVKRKKIPPHSRSRGNWKKKEEGRSSWGARKKRGEGAFNAVQREEEDC